MSHYEEHLIPFVWEEAADEFVPLMWDPTEGYYPDSVNAEQTMGNGYSVLGVEQTSEGWLGLVFQYMEEEEEESLYGEFSGGTVLELLDETMAPDKEAAMEWCVKKDQARSFKKRGIPPRQYHN